MSPTERLLELLRRSIAGATRGSGEPARTLIDHAQVFDAHEKATALAEGAMSACQSTGATAAQQRGALDAAADHTRLAVARGRDLRLAAQQLRDSLERIKLVALNAGLEGARLGEGGKALVLVGEEVRAMVVRGIEALDEQATVMSELESERDKVAARMEEARERAAAMADELMRAQAAQREANGSLAEVGRGLRRATGTDPEVARTVAAASNHARGLLDALIELTSRGHARLVLRTLRPSIEPLLRVIREIDEASPSRRSGAP